MTRRIRPREDTQIGGPCCRFHTTDWREILDARTEDPHRRQAVMGSIARRYWKPVYAFLRRKGIANEPAKDLTQGFISEIVLGRDLVQLADQSKGRFRSFLLAALNRYVTSQHRHDHAAKRLPAGRLISIHAEEDTLATFEPVDGFSPEQAFHYSWICQILEEVLQRVEADCCALGQVKHWGVFRRIVVDPCLRGLQAPTLAELCCELEIDTETKASNMGLTVRRRFKSVLWRRLRQSLSSDEQVEEEIDEILKILSEFARK